MSKTQRILTGAALVAVGLALATGAVYAQTPCNAPDNGTGTVTLPPPSPPCGYVSPMQVHMIINGLPPGTTIIIKPRHRRFFCTIGLCNQPGGPLGGEVEIFNSTGDLVLSGTGALQGWSRTLAVPLSVEVAAAPRTPGAQVQTFQTDMQRIQGSIGTGDPDFTTFEIVGGTANGFPSQGSTTLTRQADGSFNVDSSFDVGYSIRFIGAPGSKLAGYGGTTEGTVKMRAQALP
jgi:hypothetical protein